MQLIQENVLFATGTALESAIQKKNCPSDVPLGEFCASVEPIGRQGPRNKHRIKLKHSITSLEDENLFPENFSEDELTEDVQDEDDIFADSSTEDNGSN